jgi:hypothetical protein
MKAVVVLVHALRQLLRGIGAQPSPRKQQQPQQQYADAY